MRGSQTQSFTKTELHRVRNRSSPKKSSQLRDPSESHFSAVTASAESSMLVGVKQHSVTFNTSQITSLDTTRASNRTKTPLKAPGPNWTVQRRANNVRAAVVCVPSERQQHTELSTEQTSSTFRSAGSAARGGGGVHDRPAVIPERQCCQRNTSGDARKHAPNLYARCAPLEPWTWGLYSFVLPET